MRGFFCSTRRVERFLLLPINQNSGTPPPGPLPATRWHSRRGGVGLQIPRHDGIRGEGELGYRSRGTMAFAERGRSDYLGFSSNFSAE